MLDIVKYLRKVLGVVGMQSIMNKNIRGRSKNKVAFLGRVNQSTLRCFGHIKMIEVGFGYQKDL